MRPHRQQARRIREAAAAVAAGQATGPDHRCGVCRRRLTDDTSIARGIGPCCFELVLDEVGRRLPAALPAQPVFAA